VAEPHKIGNDKKVDPDADLIAAVAAGDGDAFETLVKKYERLVLNTAFRYLGDASAAEDAAQEAFLKVWRNVKRFKGKSTFSTWLYRIVVNHCLNYKAKRKTREAVPLDEAVMNRSPGPDEEYVKTRTVRVVREAVADLPGKQRTALVLSKFEKLSYKEISEIMGVSLSSVESLVFRAKQNLRKKLTPMRKCGAV
jgi:RNA polymerase sigma-70 factor (ECF subfamily)